MKKHIILYKKEIGDLIFSPTGFLIIILFPLTLSFWTLVPGAFLVSSAPDLSSYFSLFPLLYILTIPLLSLRIWLKDRQDGKELLLGLPFREEELIAIKLLALFSYFLLLLTLSLILPLSISRLGNFDQGIIFSQILGIFLYGLSALSICFFFSTLFSGGLTGWLVSTLFLLSSSGLSLWSSPLIRFVTLDGHMESFSRGVIDLSDFAFFLMMISLSYLGSLLILKGERFK